MRPTPALIGRFLRFGIVGGLGYLVDISGLDMLRFLGVGPYEGQVFGFFLAATFTWLCNRLWTFRDRTGDISKRTEWGRYLALMMIGFVINYAVYALLVDYGGLWETYPELAVACGTLAGLCFNFPASNYLVFKVRRTPQA